MDHLDVNKLLLALENDKNESLLKEDIQSITRVKTDMLNSLHLSKKETQTLLFLILMCQ